MGRYGVWEASAETLTASLVKVGNDLVISEQTKSRIPV